MPGALPAQSTESEESPAERLETLDQKVRAIELRLRVDEAAPTTSANDVPIVSAGASGFSLRSPDGAFQLKLRGVLHANVQFFVDDDDDRPLKDTFLLRRARPIFEGTVFRIFDFRLTPDFGGGTTVLQDAYFEARFLPELKLRVGKFKAPLGLERLQSVTDIRFIERGQPTNLVPNRDIGIQLHGDLLGEAFSYAAGVFNGVVDGGSGDLETHDAKDVVARVFAQPFKPLEIGFLEGLGFGIAGSIGEQEGALPSFRSAGQNVFFSYASGTAADGLRYRVSPQASWYWESLGFLAEYVLSSQEVKRSGVVRWVENDAWQVAASYLLTGEKASYKGVDPKKPFDLTQGDWGALELVARFSTLQLDSEAFPRFASAATAARRAKGWGGGINWYLNRSFKFALNYEWTEFDKGNVGGRDRKDEHAVLTRFQIAF